MRRVIEVPSLSTLSPAPLPLDAGEGRFVREMANSHFPEGSK
jgi:hypothetical protein